MNLKPLGANKTELRLGDVVCCGQEMHDLRVLFSYETPVAYYFTSPEGRLYFKTKQHYSRTTTKHINSWLPVDQAEEVEQYVIDDVVSGNGH